MHNSGRSCRNWTGTTREEGTMLTLDDVPSAVIDVARDVARRGYRKLGRGITVLALLRDEPPNNWHVVYFRDDHIDLAIGFSVPALREAVVNNTQLYVPDRELSLVVHDCRGDGGDDGFHEIVASFAAVIPMVEGDPITRYAA
jgi:hypothetical protein